jgi:hypothetical protein
MFSVCVAAAAAWQLRGGSTQDVEWHEVEGDAALRPARLAEVDDLRAAVTALRRGTPEALAGLEVPAAAELFERPVPLDRPEVREAVAYELILTVGRPLMPLLWTRRAPVVLPMIEEKLAAAGLPDDLKYLAMIESDLRWSVASPASAEGLWQIVPDTARRLGLTVNRYLDQRRDPPLATDAAIRYLRELHAEFGDWFLAVAAYNAGENRIRDALEEQGERGYFELYLPRETRRYVPRILAAKLVYEHPEHYGLGHMVPYYMPSYRTVEVQVRTSRADLRQLAEEHGLDYAAVRIANPQVRGSWLPRGTHRLRVPLEGSGAAAGAPRGSW